MPLKFNVSTITNNEDPSKCRLVMFWEQNGEYASGLNGGALEGYRMECCAHVRLDETEVVELWEPDERIIKKRKRDDGSSESVEENVNAIREALEKGENVETFLESTRRSIGDMNVDGDEKSSLANGRSSAELDPWFTIWEGEETYAEVAYDHLWTRPEVLDAYKRCIERAAKAESKRKKTAQKTEVDPRTGRKRLWDVMEMPREDSNRANDNGDIHVATGLNKDGQPTDLWPTRNIIISYSFRSLVITDAGNGFPSSPSEPIEWRHAKIPQPWNATKPTSLSEICKYNYQHFVKLVFTI
jgi:hypothetical protein